MNEVKINIIIRHSAHAICRIISFSLNFLIFNFNIYYLLNMLFFPRWALSKYIVGCNNEVSPSAFYGYKVNI